MKRAGKTFGNVNDMAGISQREGSLVQNMSLILFKHCEHGTIVLGRRNIKVRTLFLHVS